MARKRAFPRICIALGLPDAAKLLDQARREIAAGETFLEFRLDYLKEPETGIVVSPPSSVSFRKR
jgi:3-dehydroquinate dehydratase/shikimate dehydrogenase